MWMLKVSAFSPRELVAQVLGVAVPRFWCTSLRVLARGPSVERDHCFAASRRVSASSLLESVCLLGTRCSRRGGAASIKKSSVHFFQLVTKPVSLWSPLIQRVVVFVFMTPFQVLQGVGKSSGTCSHEGPPDKISQNVLRGRLIWGHSRRL